MRFAWFKFQVKVVRLIRDLAKKSYDLKLHHKFHLHILLSIWFLKKMV